MPIVYILTNESMPDSIKIGITDNLERRIKDLDNTSTPLPFECYYAVEVDNASAIEKKIHEGLDDKRVRQNREFFNVSPEQAKSLLQIAELMGGKDITPNDVIAETEQDKQALDKAKKNRKRINYFEILNLEIGTVLHFSKNENITCEVAENNKVKFRDKIVALSACAYEVIIEMGYDWKTINGASFWCYKGKSLRDLYLEKEI